jgi:hypothetical protein
MLHSGIKCFELVDISQMRIDSCFELLDISQMRIDSCFELVDISQMRIDSCFEPVETYLSTLATTPTSVGCHVLYDMALRIMEALQAPVA